MKTQTVYYCNLQHRRVDKITTYDTVFTELKRTDWGLRWHKTEREAKLYLGGYLRFLACVRYWHGQELMEKAYRLIRSKP